MNIGFTGTQKGMTEQQRQQVTNLLVWLGGKTEFWHGRCVGADEEAAIIADDLGYTTRAFPGPDPAKRHAFISDWTQPPMPYLERNHVIVDGCGLIIATPNGDEKLRSGTWATIRYARKQGKTLFIVAPNGQITNEKGAE
jgi:hypothetical protein